ncbi:MAG: hypothetical protein OXK82_09490 [Deltaproteobacteria bacterium]|nr:hypothetical protein [Deltaproteobacteria bacterium]
MVKPTWKAEQNHFNRMLFSLGLILLSGLVGCDSRDDQGDEQKLAHYQQLETLSARLDAFERGLQQQQRALQGQSSALKTILDNVSPASMPPEWEGRLKELEDQVSDVSRWPKDAGEAGRFLSQASELITGLPAPAEPQYLPRLSPVRWAAMAFTGLNDPPDADPSLERFDQLADELRALADAMPEGGAEALVSVLQERAAELAGEAARRRVVEAVEQAEQYLDGSPGTATELAALYESLEFYATDPERGGADFDISTLQKKLYKEMLRRQAVEQAATLRGRWETARKLEHDQPVLYEASARTLLQQVVAARVALVLEGVPTPVEDGLERDLRSAVATIETEATLRAEERQARAVRSYQRWALSEIRKFDDALQGISTRVDDASSWLDTAKSLVRDSPERQKRREYLDAGQFREVGQAMIDHLLPVNVALLDLPVHERYQQAFQTGWKKLDGHDDQTDVAKASAVAEKKSLRDSLEELEDGS